MRVFDPFRTGADGSVPTAPALTQNGGYFDRWVDAVVPGKLVGAARVLSATHPPDPDRITVTLLPSRTLSGRVVAPAGHALETVRVRVASLARIDGDNLFGAVFPRQTAISGFQDTLPERFDAAVATDGSFRITDLPATPLLYLVAESPGLCHARRQQAVASSCGCPAATHACTSATSPRATRRPTHSSWPSSKSGTSSRKPCG